MVPWAKESWHSSRAETEFTYLRVTVRSMISFSGGCKSLTLGEFTAEAAAVGPHRWSRRAPDSGLPKTARVPLSSGALSGWWALGFETEPQNNAARKTRKARASATVRHCPEPKPRHTPLVAHGPRHGSSVRTSHHTLINNLTLPWKGARL